MKLLGQNISRPALLHFLLVAIVAGSLSVALIGLLLHDLERQKDEILEEAHHSAVFRARLIGDHATRAIETVDLILFGTASDIGQAGVIGQPDTIRHKLRERLLFLPQVVTLAVFDAKGNLIADAKRLDAQENVSEHGFFKRHRDEGILFLLEGPAHRRFDASGRQSLRLSRLITDANGTFLGALLAEIDPAFFNTFYREEDPFGVDLVALFDGDGKIMASERPDILELGKNIFDMAPLAGITRPAQPIGGLQKMENEGTLAVFYQLANFPLRAGLFVDRKRLLDAWHPSVTETYFIIAGIVTALLGSLIVIAVLIQRRASVEAELRSSEAHLRTVFEHTDIGIAQANAMGVIHAVNPAFARMMGGSQEDFVGKTWKDFTHPDDMEVNLG
ncbi:MAG: PAS domain S-box protein, partial [Rhodospirillales bacterium]